MKIQPVSMATLYCTECNNKVTIFRKKSKMKKDGHIKHMYCSKCLRVTAHVERHEY